MPAADALVLLSPHPGQGRLLMNAIDPSVTDEVAIRSRSMRHSTRFRAGNGFADGAREARYTPDFVARYRAAQRARVETPRCDRRANASPNAWRRARAATARRGAYQSVMQVWRTDADLRCWDLTLDPSDRNFGSLWGADPFASNYGAIGFARLCTPESWLSTWSGISSKAALARTAPAIQQPTLMVHYTGDQTLFPSDAAAIFASDRRVR